jgi:hypothetical protein
MGPEAWTTSVCALVRALCGRHHALHHGSEVHDLHVQGQPAGLDAREVEQLGDEAVQLHRLCIDVLQGAAHLWGVDAGLSFHHVQECLGEPAQARHGCLELMRGDGQKLLTFLHRRFGFQTGTLLGIVQAATVKRLGAQVRQGTREGALIRVDVSPLGQSQPNASYGAIPYDQGQGYYGTRTAGSLDAG